MESDDIVPPLSPDEFGRLMKKIDRSVTKGDFHFLERHIIELNRRLDEASAAQAEQQKRLDELTVDLKWAQQDQRAYDELSKKIEQLAVQLDSLRADSAHLVRRDQLMQMQDKLGKFDENEFYLMRSNMHSLMKALDELKVVLQRFTVDETRALHAELELVKTEQRQLKQSKADPYLMRTIYDVNQLKKAISALSSEIESVKRVLPKKSAMVVE